MTDNINFRELEYKDVKQLFKFYSDEEAMKFRRSKPMKSIEEAELFVKNKKIREGRFVIIRKAVELVEQQEIIGSVMFRYNEDRQGECEIGYSIGREYWGQGYGSQIVKLLIDQTKSAKGVRKLVAWTMVENIASTKILEKNGFQKVPQNEYPESYLFERSN